MSRNLERYLLGVLAAIFVAAGSVTAANEAPGEAPSLSEAMDREVLGDANRFFAEANEAALSDPGRAKELYEAAALKFEFLLERGYTNERLYANLANTYFLSGDPGRAILNYRRAIRFGPGDHELRESLEHVRAQRVDFFAPDEAGRLKRAVFFWHYHLNDRMRTGIFAAAYLLLWTLAGWRLFLPGRRFGGARRISAMVCLVVGISIIVHAAEGSDRHAGVVVAPEVIARKGDGYIYEPALTNALHSGAEFKLRDRRGEWVQAVFDSGDDAWLPLSSVAFVAGAREP